jgi:hypothetical protein
MTQLPSLAQIPHVQHLHSAGLFGLATIVRLTGTPLRDVFRITRLLDGVEVAADGTVIDGQHRLWAALKS